MESRSDSLSELIIYLMLNCVLNEIWGVVKSLTDSIEVWLILSLVQVNRGVLFQRGLDRLFALVLAVF